MAGTYDADVIVVGAGPGGSTAAALLAKSGLRTLMLDRETFPRDKACGDAVSLSCFRVLRDLGLPQSSFEGIYRVDTLLVKGPLGVTLEFPLSSEPDAAHAIISREDFDYALYKHALDCGAQFKIFNVSGPIVEDGKVVGVRGKADKQTVELRAKIVIGADGATSAIARALGSRQPREDRWAVALRGYVQTERELDDTMEFVFLDKIQPGYAWIFPMDKHTANIGVGMRSDHYKRQSKSLNDALDYYCSTPSVHTLIGDHKVTDIKTWSLPIFTPDLQRVFDGAMLIGDAGGFINPITGAGIYPAIVTGSFAAQTAIRAIAAGDVSARGLAEYDALWKAKLGGDLRRATTLHNVLAPAPSLLDVMLFIGKNVPALVPRALGKI
jgi:geranylgeranyl reductase family protein